MGAFTAEQYERLVEDQRKAWAAIRVPNSIVEHFRKEFERAFAEAGITSENFAEKWNSETTASPPPPPDTSRSSE